MSRVWDCPQIWLCTVAARVGWACHASLDYRQIWLLTIISEHNHLPHFSPDRQTTVSLQMSPTIGWCSQSQSGVGQTPLLLPNYGAFSKLDPTINIRPSRPIILTAHKDLASLASNFLQQLNQKSGSGNNISPPSKEKSYIKHLRKFKFYILLDCHWCPGSTLSLSLIVYLIYIAIKLVLTYTLFSE